MTATPARLADRIDPAPLLVGGALVLSEVLLVTGYLGLTSTGVTQPRYLIYPFVWINVGLWAVYAGRPRVGTERHRGIGLAVAGAYYIILLAVAGNVQFLTAAEPYASIIWATPGWGPVLNGSVPGIEVHLVPYQVIGYAGLAYLFYANVLEISRGLLSGVLGIVTCVSCSMPLWGPLLGLLGGSALGLSSLATTYAYDLGTVVFLLTVALLYYFQRPEAPRVSTDGLA
jgi:hypothetical protein